MNVLLDNMPMIGVNSFLAIISVLCGWLIAAPNVLHAAFHIVSSLELLRLGKLFGVVANSVYFVFRTYRGVSITLVSK